MRQRLVVCALFKNRVRGTYEPRRNDCSAPLAAVRHQDQGHQQRNGKSVVVRINDRGPFIKGRVIDLSKAAAQQLGFIKTGHTKICMQQS